ncbi:hypothetical protein ACF3DV_04265 [Chlorogloeopsis fritschii PCC 9212]|uniref:hypothetical protein n=1 Tax=Chlorogloeopsis fritschii TaxID=1124 RepID=UPI00037F095B|nr:hypothetical protein [Chlorogloeopsis fritschii]
MTTQNLQVVSKILQLKELLSSLHHDKFLPQILQVKLMNEVVTQRFLQISKTRSSDIELKSAHSTEFIIKQLVFRLS